MFMSTEKIIQFSFVNDANISAEDQLLPKTVPPKWITLCILLSHYNAFSTKSTGKLNFEAIGNITEVYTCNAVNRLLIT